MDPTDAYRFNPRTHINDLAPQRSFEPDAAADLAISMGMVLPGEYATQQAYYDSARAAGHFLLQRSSVHTGPRPEARPNFIAPAPKTIYYFSDILNSTEAKEALADIETRLEIVRNESSFGDSSLHRIKVLESYRSGLEEKYDEFRVSEAIVVLQQPELSDDARSHALEKATELRLEMAQNDIARVHAKAIVMNANFDALAKRSEIKPLPYVPSKTGKRYRLRKK